MPILYNNDLSFLYMGNNEFGKLIFNQSIHYVKLTTNIDCL